MVIKNYLELNTIEKNNLCDFVNEDSYEKKRVEQLDKTFASKLNGFGYGSIFYILNEKIIGSIQIVLEAAQMLGKIYIYSAKVSSNIVKKFDVLNKLINEAIEISKTYNLKELMIGWGYELSNEYLKLGYSEDYSAVKMLLDNKDLTMYKGKFKLIALTEENKENYIDIINRSFSDMPHGMYHYMCDVDDYIKLASEDSKKNNYFMVESKGCIIGFLNIEIENNKGIFDIGLMKEFRGCGNGKKLLELAIGFLSEKNIDRIELIVIKKNKIAYEMYKKRGFNEVMTIGLWKVLINNLEEKKLCLV